MVFHFRRIVIRQDSLTVAGVFLAPGSDVPSQAPIGDSAQPKMDVDRLGEEIGGRLR